MRKAYWVLTPYTHGLRIPDGAKLAEFSTEWLNMSFLEREVSYAEYKSLCEPGYVACNVFSFPLQEQDYSIQLATLQQAGAGPRLLTGSPDVKLGTGVAACYHQTMFAPGTLKLFERWGANLWWFQPYGNFYGGVRPATNN